MERKTNSEQFIFHSPKEYVIIGPVDDPEDNDETPVFWSINSGWGDFKAATLFSASVFTLPLPYLPQGSTAFLNVNTIQSYTLSPYGEQL